jgi:hypothetical protein
MSWPILYRIIWFRKGPASGAFKMICGVDADIHAMHIFTLRNQRQ